ncbi:hypothetical protein CABS03_10957 [Colletotrichum abscissum]
MSLAHGPCPLNPPPPPVYSVFYAVLRTPRSPTPSHASCHVGYPPPSSSRAPVRTTCTSSREIGVLASTNSTPANATLAQKVCPPICSALVSVAPRSISPSTPSRLLFPTNSVRCMMYPVSIPSLPMNTSRVKASKKPENPLHQQIHTHARLAPTCW